MQSAHFIGHLGRPNSDYDNTFAENAEMTPPPPTQPISLMLVAACVILPGGVLVLAAILLRKYLKENMCQ